MTPYCPPRPPVHTQVGKVFLRDWGCGGSLGSQSTSGRYLARFLESSVGETQGAMLWSRTCFETAVPTPLPTSHLSSPPRSTWKTQTHSMCVLSASPVFLAAAQGPFMEERPRE